jgi:hypothetical protein
LWLSTTASWASCMSDTFLKSWSVSGQDESIFCASAWNENGLASGVPTGSQRGPRGPLGVPLGDCGPWFLCWALPSGKHTKSYWKWPLK